MIFSTRSTSYLVQYHLTFQKLLGPLHACCRCARSCQGMCGAWRAVRWSKWPCWSWRLPARSALACGKCCLAPTTRYSDDHQQRWPAGSTSLPAQNLRFRQTHDHWGCARKRSERQARLLFQKPSVPIHAPSVVSSSFQERTRSRVPADCARGRS